MENAENKLEKSLLHEENRQAGSFRYKLDLLKIEIDLINQIIARLDNITQATKNWAVVTWAGSIALALSKADLRKYVIFTTILPFLFWPIDAWWRRLQKRSIFRQRKISEFLNDDILLDESFRQQRMIKFRILDPVGQQYRGSQEYKSMMRFWRIIRYREISFFYGGLAIISVFLGLFFLFIL